MTLDDEARLREQKHLAYQIGMFIAPEAAFKIIEEERMRDEMGEEYAEELDQFHAPTRGNEELYKQMMEERNPIKTLNDFLEKDADND